MNKIADVAKLLGVEIGEEFEIKGCMGKYKITENGLVGAVSGYNQPTTLTEILIGRDEIIKLPFRPKLDEKYYIILHYNLGSKFEVIKRTNINCYEDLVNIHIGNCFKTEQEAEQNKQKIIDLLSPYIVEVE